MTSPNEANSEASTVDTDARWKEIQELSHEIAYSERVPSRIESALCGAVVRAREAMQEVAQLKALQSASAPQSETPAGGTPRAEDAEAEYHRWQEYVKQYGHLPEAMEQAPEEADPFWIARQLERELAAAHARVDWTIEDNAKKALAVALAKRDGSTGDKEKS
jgi:hypothetical protein